MKYSFFASTIRVHIYSLAIALPKLEIPLISRAVRQHQKSLAMILAIFKSSFIAHPALKDHNPFPITLVMFKFALEFPMLPHLPSLAVIPAKQTTPIIRIAIRADKFPVTVRNVLTIFSFISISACKVCPALTMPHTFTKFTLVYSAIASGCYTQAIRQTFQKISLIVNPIPFLRKQDALAVRLPILNFAFIDAAIRQFQKFDFFHFNLTHRRHLIYPTTLQSSTTKYSDYRGIGYLLAPDAQGGCDHMLRRGMRLTAGQSTCQHSCNV